MNKNNCTFKKFVPMKQNENLQCAIISDIDGTLATLGDRSPYNPTNCVNIDTPNEFLIDILQTYYNNGYKIFFITGRDYKYEKDTREFLDKYYSQIPNYSATFQYELFMRPEGDKRRDDIIKEEIFNNHIKDKYYVKCVFEDRLRVCQMWYNMGINLMRLGDPGASF